MTTRVAANASVLRAHARCRASMDLLPKWARRAFARAVRELAKDVEAFEASHARAHEELASIVDVELTPQSAREPPSLPPDKEGDEELLDQQGKMRSGWRKR